MITAASLKESQPALYKAVRNKLKLWKLSESQINQIETSGKVKENFPVYATVSGIVTDKLVAQGDYIEQGQPLFKIASLKTVWANFDVYENQIDLFKKGQEVTVTTNAYSNKEFKGKVHFIAPILNTETRTVTLRVVLQNEGGIFKPGMFVQAAIEGDLIENKAVLSIPSSAVLWTGERSVVYLKSNPNQSVFEMREITLGNQIGTNYQVLEGLNNGDEIVTNGTFTVDAAAQLQGKKSMMNKDGAKIMTGHEVHLGMENTSSEKEIINKNECIEVSTDFQKQLKVVFEGYIKLKEAFVNDDSKKVVTASNNVLKDLSQIDMKLLTDKEAHSHWMSIEKELKLAIISISEASTISEQRVFFKHVSAHLTNAIEVFGINEKVYHQFCPMADNNKGGYWLSKEEKVINPYFGETMLTCGEVKQVIE